MAKKTKKKKKHTHTCRYSWAYWWVYVCVSKYVTGTQGSQVVTGGCMEVFGKVGEGRYTGKLIQVNLYR